MYTAESISHQNIVDTTSMLFQKRKLIEYSCSPKSTPQYRNRSFVTRKSLFCVHFYKNINQDLAATTTHSSLYQYSHRNYDSICINMNLKSAFHIIEQMMETYPEYTIPLYYKHIFDWRKRPLFTQTIQSYTSQFFLHEFELCQKSEHP